MKKKTYIAPTAETMNVDVEHLLGGPSRYNPDGGVDIPIDNADGSEDTGDDTFVSGAKKNNGWEDWED